MELDRMVIEPVERIGGIIPKNKVTLVTGLPGTGKSFSMVKFLNKEKEKPIYFNLDATALGDLKADMFNGDALWKMLLKNNDFKDLKDKVVIIDTYARFEELLLRTIKSEDSRHLTNERIVEAIENLVQKYKITLIIIGHPEDYIGRSSIFKDNPALIRYCYEHLHFETNISTKKGHQEFENVMYIKKGRVYDGERIFHEWMREKK